MRINLFYVITDFWSNLCVLSRSVYAYERHLISLSSGSFCASVFHRAFVMQIGIRASESENSLEPLSRTFCFSVHQSRGLSKLDGCVYVCDINVNTLRCAKQSEKHSGISQSELNNMCTAINFNLCVWMRSNVRSAEREKAPQLPDNMFVRPSCDDSWTENHIKQSVCFANPIMRWNCICNMQWNKSEKCIQNISFCLKKLAFNFY